MNFRRPPFQFSTIDPAKRQAELQKRFGLPSNNNEMLVDFLNPGIMGSGIKEPTVGGSPRLQHRVPVFKETGDKVNSEHNNVDGGLKPRVRVVPIQVEGVDTTSKRQCTFSGPVGMERSNRIYKEKLQDPFPQTKVEQVKKPSQPRVCNIPIQIEPREEKPKVVHSPAENPKVGPEKLKAEKEPEPVEKLKTESNGCTDSKEKGPKTVPLMQIEAVLNKLKEYTDKVDKFSGTVKDKQYRYLDEMLTRCMLDLDNVDTMGIDEIRKARKEAVRRVQHYVDLLDTKVNELVVDTPSNDYFNSNNTELIPTENNDETSPDTNVNEDVEMNGDVATECADPVNLNDLDNCDVDMEEEKASNIPNSEISNDSVKVSNDAEPMDSTEMVSSLQDLKDSTSAAEIESTPCDISDSGEKSGVVIEELEDSTVCAAETVPCVVSDSPELSVKETIFEESDSDIVIEEVEDNFETGKDIVNSDSSVDTKLTVEQLNFEGNCGETETESFPDTSTVVQKNIDDFEKQ